MSKKYSKTTADYLTWDQNLNLIRKLYDDREYKLSLLIAAGSFWGLRISDILKLKWNDILNKDVFVLVETKTQKSREIRINAQLKKHINECYNHIKLSQKNSVYSVQWLNKIFKSIKSRYNLRIGNFSTHTLRKTFGREVFSKAGTNAEIAIVRLSQLFNHSSVMITRRYLGITRDELLEAYDSLSF